jgi:hypothetical protein
MVKKQNKTKPSICGKIKPALEEKGSELQKHKSSRTTCFFCHRQIVPTEVSQDNTRKQWGIK